MVLYPRLHSLGQGNANDNKLDDVTQRKGIGNVEGILNGITIGPKVTAVLPDQANRLVRKDINFNLGEPACSA